MENKIRDLLIELDLIDADSIEEFYPSVRDSDDLEVDIKVLKCLKSGIIFLSRTDHIDFEKYNTKEDPEHFTVRGEKLPTGDVRDDDRRAEEFRHLIADKNWLDFGAGYGWLLERLGPFASTAAGIEASALQRQKVKTKGYDVYPDIKSLSGRKFDIISMFHVFEHLTSPIDLLAELRDHLNPGGQIVMDVPHARDILIDRFASSAFKNFTFWSEHLVLHTRQSLETFIRAAGFSDVVVEGYQRYPLSNHLHWLARKQRGGHDIWKDLNSPQLHTAYAEILSAVDQTDSLVAFARN